MDATERRAVLALLGLAVLGHGVRLAFTDPGEPPGAVSLLPAADSGELRSQRDKVSRLMRPLETGETIDLDQAPAEELTRLPRVGPALAQAIVADRQRRGPFGGLRALDRVSGVGPAVLDAVQPFAAFSGVPSGRATTGQTANLLNVNRASAEELQVLPGIGPSLAARMVAFRELHGPFASPDSLMAVPGIGPSTVVRLRDLVRFR